MPKREEKRTALGLGLEESLQEILEWKRGERTLEVRKRNSEDRTDADQNHSL